MVVEPLIVALLLAAALMHATWNAILKSDSSDRLATLVSGRMIGEHLRSQDIIGVVLLSFGLVALAMPLKNVVPKPGGRHGLATLFAVLTGITIAGYIIADGLGVRAAGPTAEHRISYIAWLCMLEGPWLLVLAFYKRPRTVWAHLKRNWYRGVIGGVVANVGYGIAIYALVLGPMAHVAALRETSVLFGALIGTLLLGEPFGRRRVGAAAVIVLGLVLMNGPQVV